MISLQARQGIEHIFKQSVSKTLVLDAGDFCQIEKLPENTKYQGKDIVVLTISSFLFRVFSIFHICDDSHARNYFLQHAPDRKLTEVFSEISNLCSGAMNCELLRYFPHLGMSTPYTLSGGSLPYLNDYKSGHLTHFQITINGTIRLQATLCMYGYAPVDFAFDKTAAETISGELELF